RDRVLAKYRPEWPAVRGAEPWRPAYKGPSTWDSMIEPDSTIKPVTKIRTEVMDPILDQVRLNQCFLRPGRNGVSFILYGPPGSGKTYLLKQLAAALGWPLISLSPGNFIRDGLEKIE